MQKEGREGRREVRERKGKGVNADEDDNEDDMER